MKTSCSLLILCGVLALTACVNVSAPSGASRWTIELASPGSAPDGACKIYDEANRLMLEGNLAAGKMDGVWTAWGSGGDRLAVLPYINGVRNGPFQMWYGPLRYPGARGKLKLEGAFALGSFAGEITRYSPDGSRSSVRVYQGGALTSARYWSPEGAELPPPEAQKAATEELIADMKYVEALETMVSQALAQAHRKG